MGIHGSLLQMLYTNRANGGMYSSVKYKGHKYFSLTSLFLITDVQEEQSPEYNKWFRVGNMLPI